MNRFFSVSIQSGLMAFGVLAGLSTPSLAGPANLAAPSNPIVNGALAPAAEQVAWRCGPGMNCNGNWNRNRNWNGNWNKAPRWQSEETAQRRYSRGGNWNNGNWNNNDWKWKHRQWNRRSHYRSGINLGLGLALGIPAYSYYNNYYAQPQYRYVQPRRVYRSHNLSSAHVQWCYDRYRSYRAWDNSFQPYNGPRQLCYSPYS